MLRKLNRKTWCCICCLMLACALFFCADSLNVQASESCEVSVIGVTLWNNRVYTTLYCEEGTKPDTVDAISYYLDGAQIMTERNRSLEWVGDKAQLVSNSPFTSMSGNMTAIVEIASDASEANNNRTVVLGTNMSAPPVLGEEQPEETPPSHSHSYSVSQVVAPGCITGGYTVYRCSCGDSYTGNATDATGHSWGSWVVTKQPTTTEEGRETRTCSGCGATETQTIDKLPGGSETVDAQPVEGLAVFSAPATFVTLTWEAPASGTAPTAYAIYNGNNLVATIGAENLSYTVNGLSAKTSYTFKVIAMVNNTASTAKQVTVTTAAASVNSGQADLVVTDIRFSPEKPKVGDSVVFTAVVRNQGTKATPEGTIVGIRFGINGVEGTPFTWCDNYTKSVAPGESVLLTVNGGSSGASWTPGSTGTYSIHAWVDDQGRIDESNTGNNDDYSESITVTEQTPVELPDDGGTSDAHFHVANSSGYGDKVYSGVLVTVDGETSPCLSVSVNRSCFWDKRIFQNIPVTIFEKGENDTVTVRVAFSSKTITSAVVRPLSEGVEAEVKTAENGQTYVEFEISEWGSYSVEFNGSTDDALQMFVNPDYSCNKISGGTELPLGTIDYGRRDFSGTLYGSGVIWSDGLASCPVIKAYSGARVHGVTLINQNNVVGGTGVWCVEVAPGTNNVEFDYFHIFSRGSNGDGISIQSSWNIHIRNSYLRTWDDGVVLKNYSGANTNNVTVKDTVFWTDLAQSMEIGAETNKAGSASAIHDVTFEDIDIIHAFHKPSMSIHNMDNAEIRNIVWRNVTIEDAQMGNNGNYGDGWPLIIDITNVRGGEVPGTTQSWTSVGARGTIHNVTFENIRVLAWENDTANGKKPGIRILNSEYGGQIYDITIKNLVYGENGTPVTKTQLVSGSDIYCQFVHMNSVPGTAPGGGTDRGHDNTGYACNGNCTNENFDYNGSTNGYANLTVTVDTTALNEE